MNAVNALNIVLFISRIGSRSYTEIACLCRMLYVFAFKNIYSVITSFSSGKKLNLNHNSDVIIKSSYYDRLSLFSFSLLNFFHCKHSIEKYYRRQFFPLKHFHKSLSNLVFLFKINNKTCLMRLQKLKSHESHRFNIQQLFSFRC